MSKMNRRAFLRVLPAASALATTATAKADDGLPWALLKDPNRAHLTAAHLRAKYGCRTDVWLNGQRLEAITELIGSARPGAMMSGALRKALLNDYGQHYVIGNVLAESDWIYGNILWRPRDLRQIDWSWLDDVPDFTVIDMTCDV